MMPTDSKQRIVWIDYIKIFACVLVVIFHLLMSMNSAGLMAQTRLYNIISQSVYTFHVPLFFICSGYLYQKYSKVYNLKEYKNNIVKKFIALGVPYFTFTSITLLLKIIFPDSVNNGADSFFYTLFVNPIAPYWFLYVLFFIFLITPCFKSKKSALIVLAISLVAKVIVIFTADKIFVPIIVKLMFCEAFFMIGICITFMDKNKFLKKKAPLLLSTALSLVIAIILSVKFYSNQDSSVLIQSVLSIFYLYSVVMFFALVFNKPQTKAVKAVTNLFMPVYVMHTIFSAGVRAVLIHFGITNLALHIVFGLIAGFLLPTLYYLIALKVKPLMFFIYPNRCLKLSKKENTNEQV